jgi:hypothetical protein
MAPALCPLPRSIACGIVSSDHCHNWHETILITGSRRRENRHESHAPGIMDALINFE